MNKFLILAVLLSLTVGAAAETFRIKVLNTPSINIDGRECHVNDTFGPKAVIKWTNPRQAMRVLAVEANRTYDICGGRYNDIHASSFNDYLVSVKSLGARDIPGTTAAEAANFAGAHVMLGDTITFNSAWTIGNGAYYALLHPASGTRIVLGADSSGRAILTPDDLTPLISDKTLSLHFIAVYIDPEDGDIALTTEVYIYPCPIDLTQQ